jgi:large subunit ribosomal protein L30
MMAEKFVVILIRGTVNLSHPTHETLRMLGLNRKHACAVVEKNPVNEGMIRRIKDLVTWGELNDEVGAALAKKQKGKIAHLHPPRGGFERKGIKVQFATGGALGYRAEKINDLIKKML